MLKSGDKVEIIDNVSGHAYAIGEIVYFLGVLMHNHAETILAFVCTNGKVEQNLKRKDFQLLYDQTKIGKISEKELKEREMYERINKMMKERTGKGLSLTEVLEEVETKGGFTSEEMQIWIDRFNC